MNLYNIEELLVKQNPHWINENEIISGFKRDIFEKFKEELLKDKLILTLNGPRRSGKTFLMKQAIDYLLNSEKILAKNICYFQFSGSLNEKNIITSLLDLYLKKYAGNGRKYIFLDEVQFIDFWQDEIKYSYDSLEDIKFIVSGSTSLFYNQKSKESLAGRIYKIKLGALNFHEYLRFKNIEEPSDNRLKFVSNLPIYRTEFRKYLNLGQYPEIVANPQIDPKKYILDLGDQIINFDVSYFSSKINRQLFLSTVKTLSFDLTEEFSVSNIAKVLDVDRREVQKYIKILEELNLFKICYNSSLKSMRKKIVGSKKIYSLNLNLSLHINGFDENYLNDSRVYGRYFENYVYLRLLEKFENIEYFRNNGKELDFVSEEYSFEIKSGENKDNRNYIELSNRLNKKFSLITEEEAFIM